MTTAIGWGGLVPRLSYGGADLAFSFYVAGQNLTSGDGGLSSADQASAGASIILPRDTTGILPNLVRIVIEPGQVVPPGTYVIEAPVNTQIAQDLLTRDLSLEPESRFESGSDVIRITTDVLAVMKIGVAGCDVSSSNSNSSSQGYQDPSNSLASSCRLTLGDPQVGMINGDIARARLTSLTNINFVLAMTSRNGGVLRPVGRSADTKETEQVGYSASVQSQGQEFAFKCTGTLCGRSNVFEPSSSPLGTDIFFQVRVDEPELAQKRAGYYSDIITLIIQPAS